VAASPRVVQPGQPVPRGGGVYRLGRPYTVRGRTYTPRHDPTHEEVGVASWYGEDFHGRRTANGEIYDMYAFSAAHRTLPMPSYVRVTNVSNGRSVVVRVNDRGPFHSNRVIDLSKRAATVLDLRGSGVGRVRVTYVGRAPLHGNDEWLVTTVQEHGRPVPPTRVAALAPVPEWARHRPSQASAVQMALSDTLVPVPVERPREQPVQVASVATFTPPTTRATAVSSAPPAASFQTTVQSALRTVDAAEGRPAAGAPLALLGSAPRAVTPAGTPVARPLLPAAGTIVHVGSFRDAAQAFRYRDALARHGTTVVEPVNVSGITFYQVRIGPIRDAQAAQAALRDAQTQGAMTARLTQGS
jgi:rare lipoprotein A